MTLFSVLHKPLQKFYPWLEKRFLANIKTPSIQETSKDELSAWGINLKGTDIQNNYYFINKTLQELKAFEKPMLTIFNKMDLYVQKNFGTGTAFIISNIRLYDKLFILGSDEQIDMFSQLFNVATYHEELELFNHLELKTFLLDKNHPFVGLSIAEAMKKTHTDGIVLGLERKGIREINPNKETILHKKDLLIMLVYKASPSLEKACF